MSLPTQKSGPSPRTWGEPWARRIVSSGPRTIPTHVGRTIFSSRERIFSADHPHARGENGMRRGPGRRRTGPSPRTWGERRAARDTSPGARTIPTHVGRTTARPTPGRRPTDHPHARGENCSTRASITARAGPSPRTWGERFLLPRFLAAERTIPTHVGRTSRTSRKRNLRTDHPHARGENCAHGCTLNHDTGPSPRTWGERIITTNDPGNVRTIPTHVGRTGWSGLHTRV